LAENPNISEEAFVARFLREFRTNPAVREAADAETFAQISELLRIAKSLKDPER
jgi:hypothetical protein